MKRILLIYYSQSGEAARVVAALITPLKTAHHEVTVAVLRPKPEYPFPWRSVGHFFGVLPECHLGPLPELEWLAFEPEQLFDLIILVYQVWFLMPSLPVQSFLQSAEGRVLRDRRIITISVSRNMWHSASEMMKRLLKQCGARHIDNAAVTHQGPAWATFVTTPRALLFGKSNGFWRIFPPAGLGEGELARVGRFGEAIARHLDRRPDVSAAPFLVGLGAVRVNRRYVLADLLGWYWFRAWAHLIKLLGRFGSVPRQAAVYCFVVCLLFSILVLIPLSMVLRLLFSPLVNRPLAAYCRRLEQPSGV